MMALLLLSAYIRRVDVCGAGGRDMFRHGKSLTAQKPPLRRQEQREIKHKKPQRMNQTPGYPHCERRSPTGSDKRDARPSHGGVGS